MGIRCAGGTLEAPEQAALLDHSADDRYLAVAIDCSSQTALRRVSQVLAVPGSPYSSLASQPSGKLGTAHLFVHLHFVSSESLSDSVSHFFFHHCSTEVSTSIFPDVASQLHVEFSSERRKQILRLSELMREGFCLLFFPEGLK